MDEHYKGGVMAILVDTNVIIDIVTDEPPVDDYEIAQAEVD